MSERPTLTIAVPCPRCEGTRIWVQTWRIDGVEGESSGKCPDCEQGVVRVAVSCAGCRWFHRYGQKDIAPDVWGMCLHDDNDSTDPWIIDVNEDHGCLSWQEREATNGN